MSANGTNPGGTISPTAVPPPVPNLNAIFHPSINSIMIGHTFLTLLLPLLIALFYFSTPQSRRRPIFVLNVVVIILAFTAGVMLDAIAIHSILSPLAPWPPTVPFAVGIIGAFQSILVDLILLLRLISVHPLSHVGPTRFTLLTSLPILLKIARLVNLIIFIKVLAGAATGPFGSERFIMVWATTPYLKIEWSAQMVDNAYASIAFLWTIRDRGERQGATSNIHPNRVTFAQRMRTLSRIALSNFIIPTLFSIAQLVVVYRNVNVLIVNEIILVNMMIAVFGVVFATVWAGNANRREAQVDQWEDASPTDSGVVEKKHPRGYAFPGLGTWHAASSPPVLTFGSVGYSSPTEGSGVIERDGVVSEKGNSRGVVTTAVSLDAGMHKGVVTESSGSSTPSL